MQSFVYLSLDVFHVKSLIAKQRSHNSAILCQCKSVIATDLESPENKERKIPVRFLSRNCQNWTCLPRVSVCLSVLATEGKSKSENKQIVCSFEVYKIFEALKAHI